MEWIGKGMSLVCVIISNFQEMVRFRLGEI
jgi:hypothetical protein